MNAAPFPPTDTHLKQPRHQKTSTEAEKHVTTATAGNIGVALGMDPPER